MLDFTIVKDKIVLDPNIILFDELHDLYKDKKYGLDLLRVIYYRHSRSASNPFRDIDSAVKESNIIQRVFRTRSLKDLKLSTAVKKKFEAAEKVYMEHNDTSESRLMKSMDRKMDQMATLLDDTDPTIEESVTKSGETKFNTNLTIMLNLFSKIDTILKNKSMLENSILKKEGAGRVKGGGTTSFRELGLDETE